MATGSSYHKGKVKRNDCTSYLFTLSIDDFGGKSNMDKATLIKYIVNKLSLLDENLLRCVYFFVLRLTGSAGTRRGLADAENDQLADVKAN